jgi:hypothetical protein
LRTEAPRKNFTAAASLELTAIRSFAKKQIAMAKADAAARKFLKNQKT